MHFSDSNRRLRHIHQAERAQRYGDHLLGDVQSKNMTCGTDSVGRIEGDLAASARDVHDGLADLETAEAD